LAVATTRDCTWTVSTDTNWVTISGARSGQGEASIGYSIAANPVPSPRAGAIAVESDRVEITQAAAPCRFSLSRSGDSIGFAGGRLAFDLTTLTGCSWSTSVSQNWISIASGQSGNASATIGLSVAANPGARRVADVNVGGQTYTVTQDATPPPPDPTPTPAPTPSPAPAPTPTPTPPRLVKLEGRASAVAGGCPNISFFVDGERVAADSSTEYKKGKCGDVANGRELKVEGVKSDLVHATKIEVEKDDDDD
jgi:hypothetical protein